MSAGRTYSHWFAAWACLVVVAGCAPDAAGPIASEVTVNAELIEQAKAAPTWQEIEGTSMRYLVSLPEQWEAGRTWPVVVVVTGSNSNFPVIAKGYQTARGEMPFVVVVPATVSSGSKIIAERYPHLPAGELAKYAGAGLAAKLAYDADGIDRMLADVRARFGGERKVYLSGFSMGGSLAWYMAANRGDRMHVVFHVCAGIPRPTDSILPPGAEPVDPDVPIFSFQGGKDHMREGIEADWTRARAFVKAHGLTNVRRVVTWRAHSWHYEEILYLCYGHWLARQNRQ
jgi:poly(3-hydroxybutyrate) depolymerase